MRRPSFFYRTDWEGTQSLNHFYCLSLFRGGVEKVCFRRKLLSALVNFIANGLRTDAQYPHLGRELESEGMRNPRTENFFFTYSSVWIPPTAVWGTKGS